MDAKPLRNVAIVLAIAAAVYFIPGGGRAASTVQTALWALFGVGWGYICLRLYREHRVAFHSLGDRHRALLYGGIALAVFVIAARHRMWHTGLGQLIWFVLVLFVVYAGMEVFRRSRAY